MTITIAGLDPSLRNLGMVKGSLDMSSGHFILQEYALIDPKPIKEKTVRQNSKDLQRARELYKGLHQFLNGVNLVCVEIPVGSQSARSMASYGICIGLLASINISLIQVTPLEVKIAATGSKIASKQDMIDWLIKSYPYIDWPSSKVKGITQPARKTEHLADATAAIHAGVVTDQFNLIKSIL